MFITSNIHSSSFFKEAQKHMCMTLSDLHSLPVIFGKFLGRCFHSLAEFWTHTRHKIELHSTVHNTELREVLDGMKSPPCNTSSSTDVLQALP